MFSLPKLPYDYRALEPDFDEATMRLHHTKHHQTYIDKLNAALESVPELGSKSIEELLTNLDQLPEKIRDAVRNHGGGHYNHSLWWPLLRLQSENNEAAGALAEKINKTFGNQQNFFDQFKEKSLGLFGSGWSWLVKDGEGEIKIITTPNQDSPISLNLKPILGLDVWEHAYYLKYQNRRADYVAAFYKVLNWDQANKNYES